MYLLCRCCAAAAAAAAAQMYSLAWKAATGVAAVEGLAVGGWSCKTVRVQQAEAAKSAAETVRLRQQAGQELGAMRALLEQHKATHTHEVMGPVVLDMHAAVRGVCKCRAPEAHLAVRNTVCVSKSSQ
jgi:hypothetical protein